MLNEKFVSRSAAFTVIPTSLRRAIHGERRTLRAASLALGLVVSAFGCSVDDGFVGPESIAHGDASSGPSIDGDAAPTNDAGGSLVDVAASPVDAADAAPPDPRERPGIFVGAANMMRHVRSLDDGNTWVDDATDIDGADAALQGDYSIRTLRWLNGQFVAFAAKIFTSPDGKTWTEKGKTDGQWLASMLYAQGQYVSSGGYGWLATDTDPGLGTWTQHPPVPSYTTAHHARSALGHGVVNGVDTYVVLNDDGNIFHSNDAKTWAASTGAPAVPSGPQWGTGFAFGNGVFVGVLASGTQTVHSVDGATWTSSADLPFQVTGIIHAQGRFTAIGNGHVFTSTDGQTWAHHDAPTAHASELTYGHGTYISLTGSGDIYRSTDGIAWTMVFQNQGNPNELHGMAFGPL
jgi:hypothetical protein